MPSGVYKHKSKPLIDRLFAKVKKTKSCWLWTGYVEPKGHGQIQIGRGFGAALVHRVSWEIHNGPIPNGMCVCHKCDIPNCIKPSHLFLGTVADNNKDMFDKRRHAFGERTGTSKYTEKFILQIRKLFNCGIKQRQIAKKYNIPESTLSHIINRKSWKHI